MHTRCAKQLYDFPECLPKMQCFCPECHTPFDCLVPLPRLDNDDLRAWFDAYAHIAKLQLAAPPPVNTILPAVVTSAHASTEAFAGSSTTTHAAGGWKCCLCTFENDGGSLVCSLCCTPKGSPEIMCATCGVIRANRAKGYASCCRGCATNSGCTCPLPNPLAATAIAADLFRFDTLLTQEEVQAAEALDECQAAAVAQIRKSARAAHSNALPALMKRIEKLGFDRESLYRTLASIRDDAPIIVHLDLEKILGFLEKDTHYRNQFETNSSGGTLDAAKRKEWESALFGGAYDNSVGSKRPKYGALNVLQDPNGIGSCCQYGESYLVLKGVRLRTTFTPEDSSAMCKQVACCDYYAHVLAMYTDNELKACLRVGSGEERALDSSILMKYKEAQIHGDICLSKHVFALVVHPYRRALQARLETFTAENNIVLIWIPADEAHWPAVPSGAPKVTAVSDSGTLHISWDTLFQSTSKISWFSVHVRQLGARVWHYVDARTKRIIKTGKSTAFGGDTTACTVLGVEGGKSYEAKVVAKKCVRNI